MQLKRILEASGQSFGDSKPVFEVNLKHKLIKKLGSMSGKEFSYVKKKLSESLVEAICPIGKKISKMFYPKIRIRSVIKHTKFQLLH